MAVVTQASGITAGVRPGRQRRARRRIGLAPKIGFVILLILLIATMAAPLLSPDNPLTLDLNSRLAGPSAAHLLGTDLNGRDVLSRLIYGTRSSFEGIAIALGVTIVLAIPWGLAAGFGGRVADEILMRVGDGLLSFPPLVLAIGVVGVWGPSLTHSMVAVGIIFAPSVARLLRGAVLPLRRAEFVLVARSLGVGRLRVAFGHVFPNAMGPVLVQLFSLGSIALLLEAALGFLGLGVSAPTPSWGTDLASAYTYFSTLPWATVFPGVIITLGAWSISIVGDGVRDWLG
ncbi:MAG TPA: ABC transporter permease [Pseudonocardiaceae bacterium]|jgi:peptide/nickel transport system permease protein|nr:ABC transporter permease [Pseudonocardiaceae bacterium]